MTRFRTAPSTLMATALAFLLSLSCLGQVSTLKSDESILFFPGMGYPVSDSNSWELVIQGMVYETEQRPLALALLKEALKIEGVILSHTENELLTQRGRLFMADHKGGRKVVARIGSERFELGKSASDGSFRKVVRISKSGAAQVSGEGVVRYEAVLPQGDSRRFIGEAQLFLQPDLIVISDIDDTIKETHCQDRKKMLRSTFLQPFQPVPGMAELYSSWAKEGGAHLVYVSASPWPLFEPLSGFVHSNGFPSGVFLLKKVRLKDRSIFGLFDDPGKFKNVSIEPLLKQFPKSAFVLVGDSGQQDPETYASLARKFPAQIRSILIRDVTDEPSDSPRYQDTFRDLPPGLCRVFRDPAAVRNCWR